MMLFVKSCQDGCKVEQPFFLVSDQFLVLVSRLGSIMCTHSNLQVAKYSAKLRKSYIEIPLERF